MKEYTKRNGEKSIYNYKEKYKKDNQKRNSEIWKLQKKKSYYKKIGNIEKMKACQILIDIEKRKLKG